MSAVIVSVDVSSELTTVARERWCRVDIWETVLLKVAIPARIESTYQIISNELSNLH